MHERGGYMAFDPKREDYQRLALRFAHTLDAGDSVSATHSFTSFGRRFAQDRDSLPQSDSDRAFHLVVQATDLLDYQLPFASDDAAATLISRGRECLEEAVSLDPDCHDARRMLFSPSEMAFDARYRFLHEHESEVDAACSSAARAAAWDAEPERAKLAADIAMRPYLRWLASMAEVSLICGRNRETIRLCERLFSLDPHDMADARFTLALAYAKLEDDQGLDALMARYPQLSPYRTPDDGWVLLSQLSLAHKRDDLDAARQILGRLVKVYPNCEYVLVRQSELPDGAFARVLVTPYSEDEMVLAISEASVVFQEGYDMTGRGVLGAWLAREVTALNPEAAEDAMRDMRDAREGSF
jgi:tetratricopeptide (TPR) repeat protein